MREIKFKGWNKATKEMVDLYEITPLALDAMMNTQMSLRGESGLFLPFSKDIILLQFTGLHDKNGKEIYEGDILTFKNIYAGYVAFEYAEFITKGPIDYAMSPKAPNSDEVYEVIGNVYENPELLK